MKKLLLSGLTLILFGCSTNQINIKPEVIIRKEPEIISVLDSLRDDETLIEDDIIKKNSDLNKVSENISNKKKYVVAVFSNYISKGHIGLNKFENLSYSGKKEHLFNDELASQFSKLNNKDGIEYKIFLASNDITSNKKVSLIKKIGANVYLELHHYSTQKSIISKLSKEGNPKNTWKEYEGFSIYYNLNKINSKKDSNLAKLIGKEVKNSSYLPNLSYVSTKNGNKILLDPKYGIYAGNFLKTNLNLKIPAIIYDCGNIASPYEEQLHDGDFHKKIAEGIHNAIVKFK